MGACCPCLKPKLKPSNDNNKLVTKHSDEIQGLMDRSSNCELSSPKKVIEMQLIQSIQSQFKMIDSFSLNRGDDESVLKEKHQIQSQDDATHISILQESPLLCQSSDSKADLSNQMIQQSNIEQMHYPETIESAPSKVRIVGQPQKTIKIQNTCHYCNQLDANLEFSQKCKHHYHKQCLEAILQNTSDWQHEIKCTGENITSFVLRKISPSYKHRIILNNQVQILANNENLVKCSQPYCTFIWKAEAHNTNNNCPYEHYL